jgi:hypothetical protein
MFGLFAFWQPMAGEIWNVSEVFESGILCGLYAFGWALLLFANFVINYFDLSGLRQVWLGLGGAVLYEAALHRGVLVPMVRHRFYVAWAIILGHADDDGCSPGVCAHDHGMNARGRAARGVRPHR